MKRGKVECLGSVYPHPDHIGSSGRGAVYDSNGIAPTILTMCGGGNHPFVIVDDFYENRSPRYYSEIAPTLRSERIGLKVICDEN